MRSLAPLAWASAAKVGEVPNTEVSSEPWVAPRNTPGGTTSDGTGMSKLYMNTGAPLRAWRWAESNVLHTRRESPITRASAAVAALGIAAVKSLIWYCAATAVACAQLVAAPPQNMVLSAAV